mmetsp:Transcript_17715/g.37657  ORF Transcript_17715/g.37657 Transcript_17715/m.37657 type:complete len:132 (+) Transcript_17715:48-443(+)
MCALGPEVPCTLPGDMASPCGSGSDDDDRSVVAAAASESDCSAAPAVTVAARAVAGRRLVDLPPLPAFDGEAWSPALPPLGCGEAPPLSSAVAGARAALRRPKPSGAATVPPQRGQADAGGAIPLRRQAWG